MKNLKYTTLEGDVYTNINYSKGWTARSCFFVFIKLIIIMEK